MNQIQEMQARYKEVTGFEIQILASNGARAWYDKEYTQCESVEKGKPYRFVGKIGENQRFPFEFDFNEKAPADFTLSWLLNKIAMKGLPDCGAVNGQIVSLTKEQRKERVCGMIKQKFSWAWFYVTEYGIGMEVLFLSEKKQAEFEAPLIDFLQDRQVKYTNEYSDAMWVWRFKISRDYKFHNQLLKEFSQINTDF